MATLYIKVKHYKRHIKGADGIRRRCIHCRSFAKVKAERHDPMRMEVLFCDVHATQAGLNDRT